MPRRISEIARAERSSDRDSSLERAVAKTTAAKVNGKSYDGLSLKDVEAVKTLLGRLGPNSLKGLIDVLAH